MRYCVLIFALLFVVSCSKSKKVASDSTVDAHDSADASTPDDVRPGEVVVPDPIRGQIPADTRRIERFNPAKIAALVKDVPLFTESRRDRQLGMLLYRMLNDQQALRKNDKLLPSLRRDGDFWLAHVVQVDDELQAYVDEGSPVAGDVFGARFAIRAWLPTDDPAALRSEVDKVCADKQFKPCNVTMKAGKGFLRADIEVPLDGLRTGEPTPLEAAPYPARATAAWNAFRQEGLTSASYQTIEDARLVQSVSVLYGTLSSARMRTPNLDQIPRDEYYDYALRFFEDDSGIHADVHHTYTPKGRELAEELAVDVSLPTIEVDSPALEGEWAGDFEKFAEHYGKRTGEGARDDVVENELLWAAAPMHIVSQATSGLQVAGLKLPFFTRPGLLAMRVKVGRTGENTPEKPGELTGAVLFLTRKFTEKELRAFHYDTAKMTHLIGRPQDPVVEERGDRLLHIYRFDQTPVEKLLGPEEPVATSPRFNVDMKRFVYRGGSYTSMGVSKDQTLEERQRLAVRRTAHDEGGVLRVSYSKAGDLPTIGWQSVGPVAPRVSGCARRKANESQQAFLKFLRVRENTTKGLAALQDHAISMEADKCADVDTTQQWLDFEKRYADGKLETPEYGFAEFCKVDEVCGTPPDTNPQGEMRFYARCLATKYPNSAISTVMNAVEKMPRNQLRTYLERKQREEGLEECPAIDIFVPE